LKGPELHIISFDVPSPPDYGGVIDVYYKIKALAEAGAVIYLHCFQYGERGQAADLEQYCKQVWYYKRHTGFGGISLSVPYMVYSRRDEELLARLAAIEAPILFEGVHTTFYLSHPLLKDRFKAVRNQNIEQEYFSWLGKKAKKLFNKVYYYFEAALLRKYESRLGAAQAFVTVAGEDHDFFKTLYPKAIHEYIPSFHLQNEVNSLEGSGTYCLYHGNLGHQENVEAALFLINEVFAGTSIPFILAGRNPSPELIDGCAKHTECKIVANPGTNEMERLIQNAHIQVLPTFQPTGLKLKLLYALFSGRKVLVNTPMLRGTGLDDCCIIANTAEEMREEIREHMELPFTKGDIETRKRILSQQYDNSVNARRLLRCLQG
jgi:hypothetical protein